MNAAYRLQSRIVKANEICILKSVIVKRRHWAARNRWPHADAKLHDSKREHSSIAQGHISASNWSMYDQIFSCKCIIAVVMAELEDDGISSLRSS